MRNHTIHSIKRLFMVFILPLALLTIPIQALADGSPKAEGSKSKGYSHGSPHGVKANPHGGSPHGKKEGSGSKKKCDGKKRAFTASMDIKHTVDMVPMEATVKTHFVMY